MKLELQDAQAKLDFHQNPVVGKRKQTAQHPWQGEGIKEREKRRRLEEEERSAVDVAQQTPYENELKKLIFARTERKTDNASLTIEFFLPRAGRNTTNFIF